MITTNYFLISSDHNDSITYVADHLTDYINYDNKYGVPFVSKL